MTTGLIFVLWSSVKRGLPIGLSQLPFMLSSISDPEQLFICFYEELVSVGLQWSAATSRKLKQHAYCCRPIGQRICLESVELEDNVNV